MKHEINFCRLWNRKTVNFVVAILMCFIFFDTQAQETAITELYKSGSSYKSIYIEFYDSEDYDRDIQIINLNIEQGYYILPNFSVNVGANVLFTNGHRTEIGNRGEENTDARVVGTGLSGLLRLDIFTFRKNSVFIDGGLGLVFTSDDFPPGGTFWNLMSRYGAGLSINIKPNMNLGLGLRHIHFSNGKGIGHPRNPAYDGNGVYLGLIYDF